MADKQKGVVYRVNCNTCNQTYIGETGRTLKVRLKEHHRAVNVSDIKNGIAVHANEHDHPVDWSSGKILHKETNCLDTAFFVSFHIFFVFSLMKDFGPKRLSRILFVMYYCVNAQKTRRQLLTQ